MIQLRPTEQFTIVRIIGDTQDTSTYYVRAVVRNSNTNAIIETIDLTDRGDRRFSKGYEIPADVSGEGFYIDITTTVYTDSNYSVNAPDYSEEVNTYLVQDRYNRTFGLGGGGVDIDYNKIQKMIDNSIKKIVIPEQEKVNLSSLEAGIRRVISNIENIKFPEQKETDLSNVIMEIKETKKAIDEKYIPEPKEVDLNPVINKTTEGNERIIADMRVMINSLLNELRLTNSEAKAMFDKFKNKFDLTAKMRSLFNEANNEFSNEEEKKVKKNRKFLMR